MTERDFCFWLQGFFELGGEAVPLSLNNHQTRQIKNHLNMVFIHSIDPQAGDKAEALDEAHTQGLTPLYGMTGEMNTNPDLVPRC